MTTWSLAWTFAGLPGVSSVPFSVFMYSAVDIGIGWGIRGPQSETVSTTVKTVWPVKFVACVRLQEERPCLIFGGSCVELREQAKQKGPRFGQK